MSGLVTTWDIRIKKPNSGSYLSPEVVHSIEYTMAYYLRERYGNYRIVGVFPMGCQTGFYVLTRLIDRHMIHEAIIDYSLYIQRVLSVPGATISQCGQYELQDLKGAKKEMLEFYDQTLRYHTSATRY